MKNWTQKLSCKSNAKIATNGTGTYRTIFLLPALIKVTEYVINSNKDGLFESSHFKRGMGGGAI